MKFSWSVLPCGRKATLVKLTADDIQRVHPPPISMVCTECREKYRSAARLEVRYPTKTALLELPLMIIMGFSLLVLFSDLLSSLPISLPLGTSRILFFLIAATSLTGLKMAYGELERRYAITHNLAWSLHSRTAMLSLSLILSGILAERATIFLV